MGRGPEKFWAALDLPPRLQVLDPPLAAQKTAVKCILEVRSYRRFSHR